MNYNFNIQLNKQSQKDATKMCMEFEIKNGNSVSDVSENPDWFDKGVDLIINSPDGDILVDVKCDERIGITGNVAFELIEIANQEGFIKKGYGYSKIDFIYYVDWINKILYKLPMKELLKLAFNQPHKGFSAFHPLEKYFTLGILIPLYELKTTNKIIL